jgi:hypothetical protein
MAKRRALIQDADDMKEVMMAESTLFYITFLGDAPALRGNLTFTKKQAGRHYSLLLAHVFDMMNAARSLKQRQEASAAFMSLAVVPLRIH